jgi:hypothetical protein
MQLGMAYKMSWSKTEILLACVSLAVIVLETASLEERHDEHHGRVVMHPVS